MSSPDVATILIADDEPEIREALARILKRQGLQVQFAADGREALDLIQTTPVDVLLADLRMPRMTGLELLKATKTIKPDIEVIILTGYGSVEDAVGAIKTGAYDFITKPPRKALIEQVVARALERRALALENQRLKERLDALQQAQHVIGTSPGMKRIMDIVRQVAPSTATVLIQGESGTGKERIADALHEYSNRKDQPFLKVNCAALPETLLEAELFGYEKGAFTNATTRRAGRFEAAHQGTLMLDEVSEMTPAMQVKLLRVLQEGQFERLGSTKTIQVDVRLIAATNRNLEEAVKAGTFREDLYYRLNVISLTLPPLRDRKEDIPLLAQHFLRVYSRKNDKRADRIAPSAMNLLMNYHWPGNVRELENIIERAVVLTTAPEIGPEDLPAHINVDGPSVKHLIIPIGTPLEEIEQQVIRATLDHVNGDKNVAAGLLGIASRTIYRKLDRTASDKPDSDA
jgi:two-component system response regulator HydG